MALCPFEPECPQIADDAYKTAARIIQELDYVDQNDTDNNGELGERPAVLVFLPGLYEIETMEKFLKEMRYGSSAKNKTLKKVIHVTFTECVEF